MMKDQETINSQELKHAGELADNGHNAHLSYTWKLDKLSEDSLEPSDIAEDLGDENPYSNDEYANTYSSYEHDLDLAIAYYSQALAIYEKVLGVDHIKTAEMYYYCAEAMWESEGCNYGLVIDYLKSALQVFQRDTLDVVMLCRCYELLGVVCHKNKDDHSALSYLNEVLSLCKNDNIPGGEELFNYYSDFVNSIKQDLGLKS